MSSAATQPTTGPLGTDLALTLDFSVLANSENQGGLISEQISSTLEYNTGTFGRLGGLFWTNLGGAPGNEANPVDGGGVEEVDVGPYWAIYVPQLGADVRVGWLWQFFPNEDGDDQSTQGPYVTTVFNDSQWFGADRPVLTPSVGWYQDVDNEPGALVALGVSHRFLPSDLGLGELPSLQDFSLTPSILSTTSVEKYGDGVRWASVTMGVSLDYDLGSALELSAEYGSPTIGIFVNYCDGKVSEIPTQWYGGVNLGLRW